MLNCLYLKFIIYYYYYISFFFCGVIYFNARAIKINNILNVKYGSRFEKMYYAWKKKIYISIFTAQHIWKYGENTLLFWNSAGGLSRILQVQCKRCSLNSGDTASVGVFLPDTYFRKIVYYCHVYTRTYRIFRTLV